MLKRIKELLKLNEATLEQVLSVNDKDKLIKAYIANGSHRGHQVDAMYTYIDDSMAQNISDELGNSVESSHELFKVYSDEDIENTQTFKQLLYDETKSKLEDVIDTLSDQIDVRGSGDYVTLYRAVGISPEQTTRLLHGAGRASDLGSWLEHLATKGKHVGIYWADSYDKAEEFGGSNIEGDIYILKTNVQDRYIDWYETLMLRMDITLGDEDEIRLFKGTPLTIETIYDETGDEIDISMLEGKKLYA